MDDECCRELKKAIADQQRDFTAFQIATVKNEAFVRGGLAVITFLLGSGFLITIAIVVLTQGNGK